MTPAKFSSTMNTGTHEGDADRDDELQHEVDVLLRGRAATSPPSGTKLVMSLTMFGSTNQPAAQPAKNSGIAVAKNAKVNSPLTAC